MHYLALFADQNDAANQWLAEHPMALGLIFLAIGLVIGGWGVFELMTGVSRGKRGNVVDGASGKMLSIVRIVAGAGCILFALYKMFVG